MTGLWEGIRQGVSLLFPPSPEILSIIGLSLLVSGTATMIAGMIAVPIASFLAPKQFSGKRVVIAALNTALSIPAVLIGLVVYLLVNRRGMLGGLELLFSPGAMIMAQTLLALPLITALSHAALQGPAPQMKELAYSLGAGRLKMVLVVLRQGRFAFITALITGFSRVIGETGMTLMVGGNIKGFTRVMTTAISLETMKGNFELGVALGLVLLAVALLVNIVMQLFQGRE